MNTKRIDMKKNIVKQASNKFVSLYRYALNVTNASMKYTILDVIRENFMSVSIVFIVVLRGEVGTPCVWASDHVDVILKEKSE